MKNSTSTSTTAGIIFTNFIPFMSMFKMYFIIIKFNIICFFYMWNNSIMITFYISNIVFKIVISLL